VLDFFVIFFLIDATFSTGSLEAVAGAASAAIANPSVVAGASATAGVSSGTRVVELVLVLFAAPSADRLFTASGRFSVEDGELACVRAVTHFTYLGYCLWGRENTKGVRVQLHCTLGKAPPPKRGKT
jgi:hypothetical protein